MKRFSVILTVLVMLASSACVREAEIPLDINGGRLYLACFPSSDFDVTYISVTAATPASYKPFSKILTGLDIEFKVNGVSYEPEYVSVDERYQYTYSVSAPLAVGDKIEVRAVAEGYPEAYAQTVIPEGEQIEMSRELRGECIHHTFYIKRNDGMGEKHYYGVFMDGLTTFETVYPESLGKEPEYETEYTVIGCGNEFSPIVSKEDDLREYRPIKRCKVAERDMVIFEDDGGRTSELKIEIDAFPDRDGQIAYGYGHDKDVFRTLVMNLHILHLPKEVYEHYNPVEMDDYASSGLIPPFVSKTNVSGGFGWVSAMGVFTYDNLPNLNVHN